MMKRAVHCGCYAAKNHTGSRSGEYQFNTIVVRRSWSEMAKSQSFRIAMSLSLQLANRLQLVPSQRYAAASDH
jgi:hypothetical protein